jgi:hypothetical protein
VKGPRHSGSLGGAIVYLALVLGLILWTIFTFTPPAHAHDTWSNGKAVPDWVKSSCCGPEDVHHLRPDQVHRDGEFYTIDGYRQPIRADSAIPSQDGEYWIFYAEHEDGSQSNVYCFFVPMNF